MQVDPRLNVYSVIADVARQRLGGFLGSTFGGKRNLYEQFGYPQLLLTQDYINMYLRNDIASRIVRAFPQATWREAPTVWDQDGNQADPESEDYSPFVEACARLFEQWDVLSMLERADRLSGVGKYSVLFMGFRDGLTSEQPLKGKSPLLFLQPYVDISAMVSSWNQDVTDARFGRPLSYALSPTTLFNSGMVTQRNSIAAHWTRCVHVTEWLDQDETYGTPRLQPIYNRLMDLEKVVGASAETFWLNSREGMAISAKEDTDLKAGAIADMKKQAEEYQHQLRRIMAFQGVEVTTLQATIADLGPNVEKLLDLISGAVGIPKRILVGSERGSLASDQDEDAWAARISERRRHFAAPKMLKPLMQVMIDTGNLPMPNGDWGVEWPDEAQTPEKEAAVAFTKSNTLKNWLSTPGADLVVPLEEFRTKFLQLDPTPPEGTVMDDLMPEDTVDEQALADEQAAAAAAGNQPTVNAAPRTLYVYRPVLNAKEIIRWAKSQGFNTTLAPADMHVTIAYSEQVLDWMKIVAVSYPEDGHLTVPPGGPRVVEQLGPGGAVCLLFNSNELSWRHVDMLRAGASWKWPTYQPHITLTYQLGDLDLAVEVRPYLGDIVLGPEVFEEVQSGFAERLVENRRRGEIVT